VEQQVVQPLVGGVEVVHLAPKGPELPGVSRRGRGCVQTAGLLQPLADVAGAKGGQQRRLGVGKYR
jgi:hypothetical protein